MNALGRTWSMWIVRGIASVVFGVLTIVQPSASIAALVFIYGLYAVADGALLVGFGFRHEGRKAPYLVRGVLGIAAGLVAFLWPGLTALSLYVLVGAWAIAAGATEIGIAVAAGKEGASVGGLVAAGILSLACGVALLALPMVGVLALVGLIAAYAVLNGVALVVAGVRIRNVTRALRPA